MPPLRHPVLFCCHSLSLYQCLDILEHKDSAGVALKETTVPLAWHLVSIGRIPRGDLVTPPPNCTKQSLVISTLKWGTDPRVRLFCHKNCPITYFEKAFCRLFVGLKKRKKKFTLILKIPFWQTQTICGEQDVLVSSFRWRARQLGSTFWDLNLRFWRLLLCRKALFGSRECQSSARLKKSGGKNPFMHTAACFHSSPPCQSFFFPSITFRCYSSHEEPGCHYLPLVPRISPVFQCLLLFPLVLHSFCLCLTRPWEEGGGGVQLPLKSVRYCRQHRRKKMK